ncbi:molybdopterin-dependent oxidoreductase [Hyphobacterium sp.]|uniref:molybdopterin-dependent oxidoreductase n=1 Tax=Hyphobacterium sp. TaxID=2004662 RepID=UPI003BAD447A
MLRLLMVLAAAISLAACSADPDFAEGGDLVTIHGAIGTVDRGAVDPETEPLFRAYGIQFETACVMPFASLADMDQHTVRVAYPQGGETRTFSGPLLRDVLAVANPQGTSITVTALDGYQRDIPLSAINDHDVILAIRMDGDALNLGGFGPAMLVWPRDTDSALAETDDSDWVWGVFSIEVR